MAALLPFGGDGRRKKRFVAAGLGTCLAVALVIGVAGQANRPPSLFIPLPPGSVAYIPASPTASSLRQRVARIVPGMLDAVGAPTESAPGALRLNLFDNTLLDALITDATPTSAGYTLSGHIAGDDLSSIVFAVDGQLVVGMVHTQIGTFQIRPVDETGVVTIRELHPASVPTGAPPLLQPGSDESHRARPIRAPQSPRAEADSNAADDGSRIDVLVVYTPAARRAAGGRRQLEAWIDLVATLTNQAYQRSGVIQRIDVVNKAVVNYTERVADLGTDLRNLTNGRIPGVRSRRNRHAADLVVMVIDASRLGPHGRAWVMTTVSASFERFAYGVVRYDAEVIFPHELGHLMGVNHDRYQAKVREAKDLRDQGPYPYSFGYVNQAGLDSRAAGRRRWRTIMAYDSQCSDRGFRCLLHLRFSNPNQQLHGDRVGVPGTTRTARINGPANARLTLNRSRRTVANFRRGGDRPPLGPDLVVEALRASNRGLRPGQAVTLSATVRNIGTSVAMATTLRYQHQRAGNAGWAGVGRDSVSRLAKGAATTESTRLRAPSSPGRHRYRACVERVPREADTNNNCSNVVVVTVQQGAGAPDLVVRSVRVSDDTLNPRQPFTFYGTVRNVGSAVAPETRLRYQFWRADATRWVAVGSDQVASLRPSAAVRESVRLIAPSARGTYRYRACVVAVEGETNTNNNCSVGVPVTVGRGGDGNGCVAAWG